MVMKIGDNVNLKDDEGNSWKGSIIDIVDKCGAYKYSEPIAHVKSEDIYHAVVMESDMEYKNNEWWKVNIAVAIASDGVE